MNARIATQSAADGLASIYAYAADPAHDTPFPCEGWGLDRLMTEREQSLVTLVVDHRVLSPQRVFHCRVFDRLTTACNGAFADDTPMQLEVTTHEITAPATAHLSIAIPGARLVGLYRAPFEDLYEGKPATQLGTRSEVRLALRGHLMVVVAMLTAPAPWKYRKMVWYIAIGGTTTYP